MAYEMCEVDEDKYEIKKPEYQNGRRGGCKAGETKSVILIALTGKQTLESPRG